MAFTVYKTLPTPTPVRCCSHALQTRTKTCPSIDAIAKIFYTCPLTMNVFSSPSICVPLKLKPSWIIESPRIQIRTMRKLLKYEKKAAKESSEEILCLISMQDSVTSLIEGLLSGYCPSSLS